MKSKKHIAEQFEFPNLPPAKCKCRENEAARKVNDIFNALRFDKETHLGEGAIRLTVEKQNEILEVVGK
jgi:hypothetical protein